MEGLLLRAKKRERFILFLMYAEKKPTAFLVDSPVVLWHYNRFFKTYPRLFMRVKFSCLLSPFNTAYHLRDDIQNAKNFFSFSRFLRRQLSYVQYNENDEGSMLHWNEVAVIYILRYFIWWLFRVGRGKL